MEEMPSEEIEHIASEHPLDDQEVKDFLKGSLPEDLNNDLERATRPQLSPFADQQEREEAEKIRLRRSRFPGEEVGSWATRTMYEETFAVIPEHTLGGILSHNDRSFLGEDSIKNPDTMIGKLKELGIDIDSASPEEALRKIKESQESGKINFIEFDRILQGIVDVGVPSNIRIDHSYIRVDNPIIERDPTILTRNRTFRSLVKSSWLYLRAYSACKDELSTQVADRRLIDEFGLEGKTKMQALAGVWRQLGNPGPVLDEEGTFKHPWDEGFEEGVRKLAIVRASPDFKFLYENVSALGAINSKSTAA